MSLCPRISHVAKKMHLLQEIWRSSEKVWDSWHFPEIGDSCFRFWSIDTFSSRVFIAWIWFSNSPWRIVYFWFTSFNCTIKSDFRSGFFSAVGLTLFGLVSRSSIFSSYLFYWWAATWTSSLRKRSPFVRFKLTVLTGNKSDIQRINTSYI